jgi:hypothetical protein
VFTIGVGPVQAVLVAALMSSADQGAWYALSGLQRFQALIDLGAGTTLGMLVARAQSPARVGGLVRYGVRWHFGAGAAWILIAGPLGALWIAASLGREWVLPWLALVLASAAGMLGTPLLVTLEARGRVADIYQFRVVQGLRARVLAWGLLAMGLGPWALAAERLSAAIDALYWLWNRAPELREAIRVADDVAVKEIWPYQWRVAAATAGGALPHALIVPIVIARFGAEEGGRLGAALVVLGGAFALGYAVLTPVLPQVGALLAAEQREAAWNRFLRGAAAAALLHGATAIGCAAALLLAPVRLADRVPSQVVFGLVAVTFGVRLVREAYVAWCRADLRPVTWPVDLAEGLLCAPLFAFAGRDPAGVCAAFLASSVVSAGATVLVGRVRS